MVRISWRVVDIRVMLIKGESLGVVEVFVSF